MGCKQSVVVTKDKSPQVSFLLPFIKLDDIQKVKDAGFVRINSLLTRPIADLRGIEDLPDHTVSVTSGYQLIFQGVRSFALMRSVDVVTVHNVNPVLALPFPPFSRAAPTLQVFEILHAAVKLSDAGGKWPLRRREPGERCVPRQRC